MTETTYRAGSGRGYTVILREAAQDARLSLKARGLFLLMQSLPENWSYTLSGLALKAGCGKDQVRAALRELESVGYLVKEQSHDEAGRFAGAVYLLQEDAPSSENPTTVQAQTPPLSENPISGNPSPGNPMSGNPTVKNKDLNTQDLNIPPISPQTGDGGAESKGTESGAKGGAKAKNTPRWKPDRFERFWAYYRTHGRGQARDKAVRAWDALKPDDALLAVMGRALVRQAAGEAWRRGIGIPYASTWLNGRRWEDPVGTALDARSGPENSPEEGAGEAPEVFGWG